MIIKLTAKWVEKMLELPETGMGAQHVDIFMKSGAVIRDVTVFNAEECQTEEVFTPNEIEDIRSAGGR